jgi:membrane protease YdiL (CAAX protease family)
MSSTARALGLVVVIVSVEYLARHIVAPALPVLATPRVDDMLVTGVAYIALSLIVAKKLGARPEGGWRAAVKTALGAWQGWVGGVVALCTLPIALVDHALWGSVRLPSFALPSNPTILISGARWLEIASLMLVNAFVVPLAEEWLWRGVVQPRLVSRMGAWAGVGLTACLFSIKHAVIDASLGRLLIIAVGGVVLGWVALRASWRASALSHVILNAAGTALATLLGALGSLGSMGNCSEPPLTLPMDLEQASNRIVALVDSRDRTEIESLFSPGFLGQVGEDETVRVLTSVHDNQGHCRLRCVVSLDGPYRAVELLECERGTEWMSVAVGKAPPHLVTQLVVHPWVGGGR